MDYTLKVWLTFGISLCIAILIVFVVWKSYKYIRGLVKRCTLLKKIKKICKTRDTICLTIKAHFCRCLVHRSGMKCESLQVKRNIA